MEPPTSLRENGRSSSNSRRSSRHTYNETNPNLMNSHRRSKSRGRASRSRSKSRGRRQSRNELQQQQPSPIINDRLATQCRLQLDNNIPPTPSSRQRRSRSKSRSRSNNNLNSKATAALEKAYKNASNEKDILLNNNIPPPPPRVESLAQHLSNNTNNISYNNSNNNNRGRSSRSLDVRNTQPKKYNNKSSSKSCVNYNYNYKDNPPPPPPPRNKNKKDGKVREGQQLILKDYKANLSSSKKGKDIDKDSFHTEETYPSSTEQYNNNSALFEHELIRRSSSTVNEEIPSQEGRGRTKEGGNRNKEGGGRSASRRRDRRSVSRGRMREVGDEGVKDEKVRSTSRGRRQPKSSPRDPEESLQHADEVKSCRQPSRSRRRHSERRMSKSSNDLAIDSSYLNQDNKLEGSSRRSVSRGGRRRHKSSSPQDKVKEHRPQHEPLSRSSSADVRGSRRQRSIRSKPRSRTYSHDNQAMSSYDYEAAEQAEGGVLASPHHTPKSHRRGGGGRNSRQVKNEINLLIDSNGRGQFHISTKHNNDDTNNNQSNTSSSDGSSTSNTQLTFDIQIDESTRRYLIHTSMGQLDKIREIHSNMNILRTLSHWNTVQKNNHEYEFVGQLGIVPKNNGKTNLIMMTLMGEYTMSSNWENDVKFSSELERFVEDALQFHLCLNGLDNSASTAATDNSGRRRDEERSMSMNDDTNGHVNSGSKIRGTDRGTKSALSAGGGSLRNLFNKTR